MAKPMMPIELPYNLKHDELVVSEPEKVWDEEGDPMNYIIDQVSWDDDQAMELIFRGAVLLYNRPDNKDSFMRCLDQSVVWYAG